MEETVEDASLDLSEVRTGAFAVASLKCLWREKYMWLLGVTLYYKNKAADGETKPIVNLSDIIVS